MELNLITADLEQAKAAYADYVAAVKANHDEEDEAIARGYKALADGKRLVNLPETLRAGGTTVVRGRTRWSRETVEVTVPQLAVARAGARTAHTTGINARGGLQITADKKDADLHVSNRRDRIWIADGTFDPVEHRLAAYVRAIVPNIPPRLRPKRGLHLYTILWEAEWAIDPVPPIDPALLRHLGGDLYVLCGTWDLTDLERAVLAARV